MEADPNHDLGAGLYCVPLQAPLGKKVSFWLKLAQAEGSGGQRMTTQEVAVSTLT